MPDGRSNYSLTSKPPQNGVRVVIFFEGSPNTVPSVSGTSSAFQDRQAVVSVVYVRIMDCCTSRWPSPWEQCRGTCHSFLFSFLVLVDVYLIREETCSEGFNRTARFSWDRSDLKRSLLIMDKFYFISVCFTCLRMDSAIVDNFEIVENVPRLKSGMFVIWPLTNIPVATDNTGTPETISSFLTISTKNLDNFDKLFPSRYSWQLEQLF